MERWLVGWLDDDFVECKFRPSQKQQFSDRVAHRFIELYGLTKDDGLKTTAGGLKSRSDLSHTLHHSSKTGSDLFNSTPARCRVKPQDSWQRTSCLNDCDVFTWQKFLCVYPECPLFNWIFFSSFFSILSVFLSCMTALTQSCPWWFPCLFMFLNK